MIEIIYEDKDVIVCRKPSGIPVQTAKLGQKDMVSLLKNYRVQNKETAEIYMVHRLDQPVEGVMVFAKTKKSSASLSKQIQERTVDKYYWAVVEGVPKEWSGRLENELLRDGKTNTSKVVNSGTKGAKKAVLFYKVLQTKEEKSLVEIRLETGRHHQIRVQMSYAGYPLTGDKKYNPGCIDGYMPVGLCSVRLAFVHPVTGEMMNFSMEPKGEAFSNFLEDA